MVATDARTRPAKLRRDWRYRFVTARDRLLIELGIENHALAIYDGWRSMHERVVQGLAERTASHSAVQSAARFSLGLLPLARTRKLYKASLTAIHARSDRDALPELLAAMVEFETISRAAPLSAGFKILELLSSEKGRQELAAAAGRVLTKHPNSPFLIYLRAASLAKNGNITEAHDLVMAAIQRCQEAATSGVLTERNKRRYNQLNKVWRVIDTISRDAAAWSDGSNGDMPAWAKPEGPSADTAVPDAAESVRGEAGQSPLVFSEQLLQGRQYDRYLEVCKNEFDDAEGLHEKFGALRDMLREGLRRTADYHAPYSLASACFEEIKPRWAKLADPSHIDSRTSWTAMRATAKLLSEALQIARQLRRADDVARLERSLLYLAGKPAAATAIWTACFALVEDSSDAYVKETIDLVTRARRDPEGDADLREYFMWARRVQRYDLADALYDRLPARRKISKGVLHYAAVLQQEGRFAEAANLIRTMNANLLRQPGSLDANFNWSQIRRAGELEFAAETAQLYSSVPQPRSPQGVIFLAPRGIVQMRLFPLVVLMEMKKRGWAVVPLTKGALPLEPTGVAEIDRFLGCMTLEGKLDRKIAGHFPEVSGFEGDVVNGHLRWNGVNLDHVLWEDAAINRRRYHVDYTCPSLRGVLDRLARWTKVYCSVLEAANGAIVGQGMRCGFLVLQQSRLPDAVVRLRLQEIGDADKFFCVHSANGYENYFVNFKSAVSTKTALRNLTRHAEMRTASFPVPEEFEAFYRDNRASAPEMLRSVQDITRTRRSTAGQTERAQEARSCMEQIVAWRKRGGKVACLFGKVVCDSGVPFDGGTAHSSLKDWLNHAIDCVRGSDTLLLIKPHPHETRNEIGVFLTEWFVDLIEGELPENVVVLGHRWFDLHDLEGLIDLGVIYNGTSAAELGVLGIPAVLGNHFAPIDYPIGHAVPRDRAHFRALLRFEEAAAVAPDLQERAAAWLTFMSSGGVSRDYRYHARPITNKIVYPPWWFAEDLERYDAQGDRDVELLAEEIVATGHGDPSLKAAE
ncbi:hypothetical protein RB623_26365 [Mesorhizobium sp. LHD-90]|uniref:hypothetical protein n=1 Tax=Mesorhizobium sp. LHD-90 TaxID=3071414 RepID=UPI0027DEECDF|nr:hypothetical protein [Mesorhizobium sp. LHD-90]MDQ6437592.1 hypothetical protein [Mesorhizobium sp. LHD-90]